MSGSGPFLQRLIRPGGVKDGCRLSSTTDDMARLARLGQALHSMTLTSSTPCFEACRMEAQCDTHAFILIKVPTARLDPLNHAALILGDLPPAIHPSLQL